MSDLRRLRDILFIIRVTIAAAVSYLIAAGLGLDYPAWASVSAIVVSQESLTATRTAAVQRLMGTLAGVVIAMATGLLVQQIALGTVWQMSAGLVVACAIARKWPAMKVAMWTVPIVYLSNQAAPSPVSDGIWRGLEVLVGGLAGAVVHFAIDALFRKIAPAQGDDSDTHSE